MKQTTALVVCLVVSQVAAQYGPPPTKGKKHRTTTTTTEGPGGISNEVAGPFPITDSGSYPFPSPSAGPSNVPSNTLVPGGDFWWQGPNSPFKSGGHPPSGGCGGAPGSCGPFPPPPPPPPSGGCGGPAGCTGVGTDPRPSPTELPGKPVDIAQNPFLSSAILGKPIPQSPQGCQGAGGGCQYPSGPGTGPTQYPGSPTPTGGSQYPGQHSQYPGQPTGPSTFPGAGPTQFPGGATSPANYPGQPLPTGSGPSGQYPGQPSVPLRPICSVPGSACVPSSMCVGGFITSNGMRQMRDPQVKECIPGLEACCRIPPGGSPPGPGYAPTDNTSQRPYTGPLNTTPYPGCPAALKCVAEVYCTVEGVMSNTPVVLTREDQENRVPLTECQNPDNGIIGKCCRDPNYKDPWPAGMMKGPGDFDDGQYHGEGSGPGVNIGPSYNTISSTPQTPGKDHGPKPSDGPGGFNKPFPPPFPGSTSNPSYTPGRPQPSGTYQPGQSSPTGPSYQPGQPTPSGTPYQPGQPTPTGSSYPFGQSKPSGTPYQPGQPSPIGSYQPGQPSGTPYQPGQPSPTGTSGSPNQPGKPSGSPFQPGYPTGTSYKPAQPSPTGSYQPGQTSPSGTYQPGQPSPTGTYQPGQPSPTGTYQPGQPSPTGTYQPGQPTPTGTSFQPGQPNPTGTYQPGQPSPTGTYQPGQPNPTGTYQPGQPTPTGTSYQPGQPSGSPYQPGQPSPTGTFFQPGQPSGSSYQPGQPTPSQPDFPGQQTDYNIPTHPGHNQPSGPLPGSSCGIRRPGPDGDVAGFAEFPWQALVVSAGNRSLLCGGAIIADNAVITAAHCVNQLLAKDLLVKVGEWKLLGQNPKPVQVRPVVAIARHPGFDSGTLAKDLAILMTAEPFTFDFHVDKICIPPELGSEYFQKPGQNCILTGWGKNALLGPVQNSDLHKVPVNVVPAKQCEAKLKTSQNLGKYFVLNEGFSCALPPTPTDLCKVDFGSAVACERGDGHYELAGVNSWDIACQTKQPLPSVFATSDALWINTVLSTPLNVLQTQEQSYVQSLQKGESVDGVDIDDKPGFSQGYGK